jgi:hypothetical protein
MISGVLLIAFLSAHILGPVVLGPILIAAGR